MTGYILASILYVLGALVMAFFIGLHDPNTKWYHTALVILLWPLFIVLFIVVALLESITPHNYD